MKRRLMIWSIVLTIMMILGCKTVTEDSIHIPPLTFERPERPYLEGSYENMVRQLIIYSEELEVCCERYEQYIDEIDRILNEG